MSHRAWRTRSAPDDGEPVPREEELGVELQHAPQRVGPLARVALHLLGVPRVGRGPDEQVAATEHPRVGLPGDRVVVGLAFLMAQREAETTDRDVEAVVVGAVRVAVLGRPDQIGEAELAAIDDRVVPRGEDVAVEAGRQRVVGDDLGRRPTLCATASSSQTGTPKTWSMWPWE